LGADDKNVFFFLLPDKICKVTNNVSKGNAKITLKLNRIGKGGSDFEEIEFPIDPANFDKAIKMFSNLPFDEIQESYQNRHNYMYKGVELALKYTQTWGYHLELEIVVDSADKKDAAEKQIHEVAVELGVHIMSDEELKEFAQKIDENYRQGKYKK